MHRVPRHKVFISFHHADQHYKDQLVSAIGNDIIDKSVEDGDIGDGINADIIRQRIRDNFIRDATVTVVLIGPCTWQRKHVDWEIGSSLRNTKLNPRCGLLGIILPNHWDYDTGVYHPSRLPPRLADNCKGSPSYAKIYNFPAMLYNSTEDIREWIHSAFLSRDKISPDNSRRQFVYNRSGDCSHGW